MEYRDHDGQGDYSVIAGTGDNLGSQWSASMNQCDPKAT
jgi:hypothetical protein